MELSGIQKAEELAAEITKTCIRRHTEGAGCPPEIAAAIAERPHAIDQSILSPAFFDRLGECADYLAAISQLPTANDYQHRLLRYFYSAATALIDENNQLKLKCDGLATEILRLPVKLSTPNVAMGVR